MTTEEKRKKLSELIESIKKQLSKLSDTEKICTALNGILQQAESCLENNNAEGLIDVLISLLQAWDYYLKTHIQKVKASVQTQSNHPTKNPGPGKKQKPGGRSRSH